VSKSSKARGLPNASQNAILPYARAADPQSKERGYAASPYEVPQPAKGECGLEVLNVEAA